MDTKVIAGFGGNPCHCEHGLELILDDGYIDVDSFDYICKCGRE